MTTPLADRFNQAFDDYCERNGIVGDLKPFAEAIAFYFYREGYGHASEDANRIMEVEFAKARGG